MHKISVIVPVYNASKFLNECIDSLINQTYKNIEIILVNDGSSDNSLEICQSYNDNRIIAIDKKNGGVSSARNKGLKKASGDIITFLDSDDFLELDAIENINNLFNKHNPDVLRFNYKILNGEVQKIDSKLLGFNKNLQEEFLKGNIPAYVHLIAVKKEMIDNLTFDENLIMMEDLLFIIELLNRTNKVFVTDLVTLNYRIHEDSCTNSKTNYKKVIDGILKVNLRLKEIVDEKYVGIMCKTQLNLIYIYFEKMFFDNKSYLEYFLNNDYSLITSYHEKINNTKKEKKIYKCFKHKNEKILLNLFKARYREIKINDIKNSLEKRIYKKKVN